MTRAPGTAAILEPSSAAERAFANVAFHTGDVSAPFRSSLGYHVFRLDSKDALEGEGLNRVKAQIREILFREKFDARLDAWLKEIKQRAIIDVRLDGSR